MAPAAAAAAATAAAARVAGDTIVGVAAEGRFVPRLLLQFVQDSAVCFAGGAVWGGGSREAVLAEQLLCFRWCETVCPWWKYEMLAKEDEDEFMMETEDLAYADHNALMREMAPDSFLSDELEAACQEINDRRAEIVSEEHDNCSMQVIPRDSNLADLQAQFIHHVSSDMCRVSENAEHSVAACANLDSSVPPLVDIEKKRKRDSFFEHFFKLHRPLKGHEEARSYANMFVQYASSLEDGDSSYGEIIFRDDASAPFVDGPRPEPSCASPCKDTFEYHRGNTALDVSRGHLKQHKKLHMKFPNRFGMPPKDLLEETFSTFGAIDPSRTKFHKGFAEVVFLDGANAYDAYEHARNENLFGTEQVHYWLHSDKNITNLPRDEDDAENRFATQSEKRNSAYSSDHNRSNGYLSATVAGNPASILKSCLVHERGSGRRKARKRVRFDLKS